MLGKNRRWRQINIRAVLFLTLIAATFAAGYRSGHAQSDEYQFQELIRLIEETVVPDTWEALGGPSTMAPFPHNQNLINYGCYAEVVDELAAEENGGSSESGGGMATVGSQESEAIAGVKE